MNNEVILEALQTEQSEFVTEQFSEKKIKKKGLIVFKTESDLLNTDEHTDFVDDSIDIGVSNIT